MLKHIVFFKFKPESGEQARAEFVEMIRAMPAKISDIVELQAGRDVLHQPRSYDLALVVSFADKPALRRYANHEHHVPVIARSKELCADVVSVDYEY